MQGGVGHGQEITNIVVSEQFGLAVGENGCSILSSGRHKIDEQMQLAWELGTPNSPLTLASVPTCLQLMRGTGSCHLCLQVRCLSLCPPACGGLVARLLFEKF